LFDHESTAGCVWRTRAPHTGRWGRPCRSPRSRRASRMALAGPAPAARAPSDEMPGPWTTSPPAAITLPGMKHAVLQRPQANLERPSPRPSVQKFTSRGRLNWSPRSVLGDVPSTVGPAPERIARTFGLGRNPFSFHGSLRQAPSRGTSFGPPRNRRLGPIARPRWQRLKYSCWAPVCPGSDRAGRSRKSWRVTLPQDVLCPCPQRRLPCPIQSSARDARRPRINSSRGPVPSTLNGLRCMPA